MTPDGGEVDVRMRALAHPARRAMVLHALTAERTSSQLADLVGLSRPATSQHLAGLVTAGLLSVRVAGRNRHFRAKQAALDTVRDELAGFWAPRLTELKRLAEA